MLHFGTNNTFQCITCFIGHKRDLNINICDLNNFLRKKWRMKWTALKWHDIGYTFRKLWERWGSSEGLNQIFTHPSVNASNSSGEPYCPHVQLRWHTPLVIFSHFSLPVSSASISSPHLQNRNLQLTAVKMRGLHNTWKNYSTCWPRDTEIS